jgi:hypothetical protein
MIRNYNASNEALCIAPAYRQASTLFIVLSWFDALANEILTRLSTLFQSNQKQQRSRLRTYSFSFFCLAYIDAKSKMSVQHSFNQLNRRIPSSKLMGTVSRINLLEPTFSSLQLSLPNTSCCFPYSCLFQIEIHNSPPLEPAC